MTISNFTVVVQNIEEVTTFINFGTTLILDKNDQKLEYYDNPYNYILNFKFAYEALFWFT